MAVAAVMNRMLPRPTSNPAAKAVGWFGMTVSTARATPKMAALRLTMRTSIRLRRALASAPANDPQLTTDISQVKVTSLPRRSRVAKRGSTVWKLKASVPMSPIISSGTHSSGTLRA